MKQIFQSLQSGVVSILEIPVPNIKNNQILIRTNLSLISAGTEKMLLEFGKSNYLEKASKQPAKVKEVMNKITNDGLKSTLEAVKSKLEEPISMGYCNVGIVEKVGDDIQDFKPGDRVISNGPHAELCVVSKNLCAKVPNDVTDEQAVFTVLSSIALQSTRLANVNFGETTLVIGLGLIGLITVQFLKAAGCDVYGIDPDESKVDLANSLGVQSLASKDKNQIIQWCKDRSNNFGMDAVIISASTKSNDPISIAANVSRKRGKIVLSGVSGLDLNREEFYNKELSFQVSCSYGPGRYDKSYEKDGIDYPIGFVRWTEKRNFEAVLNSFSKGKLDISKLITHQYDFNDSLKAYDLLTSKSKYLGILLRYKDSVDLDLKTVFFDKKNELNKVPEKPYVSFIGSGNYASRILIPIFKKTGVNLNTIVANEGIKPVQLANKFKFIKASTEINEIDKDQSCNTVVIATRHDSHADLAKRFLLKGKNIFLEKPLCLNKEELEFFKTINLKNQIFMIGFNRRFAPLVSKLKDKLKNKNIPKSFIYTINAGFINPESWIHDKKIGGGRYIGEACHFIDLLRYLSSSSIIDLNLITNNKISNNKDVFIINIEFEDGSIGSINYFANGNNAYPKEKIDVFCGGSIYSITNFKELSIWEKSGHKRIKLFNQDKGQLNCVKSFINAIENGGDSPIPFSEIIEVHEKMLNY